MNLRHLAAIARKEWRHISRDAMSIFLLGIGPVFMLIITSYAMATDVSNVPVAVYDQDQSAQSAALIARLDATATLNVTEHVASLDALDDHIEHRRVRLAVIIEPGFSQQVSTPGGVMSIYERGPALRLIVDGTEPISAETAIEAALNTTNNFVTEGARELLSGSVASASSAQPNGSATALATRLEAPIEIATENRYNPDLKSLWDLVPAMIAVTLSLPGISISTVIARERSQGTLEGLFATPLDRRAILLGKAIPYIGLALLNVALMLVVARVVFGLPFRGSLPLYLGLSTLYMLATLAIGLLFSILIKSMEAALWASMLFFLFPGMLLSGMFFPVEVFPTVLQIGSLEVPATTGVLINRGIFLQGADLRDLWWAALLLLVLAVEGFEIAGRLFKKRIA